jgi:hypothetical protein
MSEIVPFSTLPLNRHPLSAEVGHGRRIPTRSGFWSCALTTLTPLCIQSSFAKLTDQAPAILPGSSLRGMVRNVVEILGAACGRLYSGPTPDNLEICGEQDTCLACRVFGFTLGDFAWSSKLRFADSRPGTARATERLFIPQERGYAPAPTEDGWVVFPHFKPRLASGPIRCVPAGQSFHFLVEYLNLDEEEYAVSKFALTLSYGNWDLCHKLGYAKSAGLGSVKISLPNDRSPAIGPSIERYLDSQAFTAFARLRNYR